MYAEAYGGWLAALVILLASLALGGTMIFLAKFIGPSRKDAQKDATYECGETPFSDAREPFDVKFYLVGVLFLLFDLETVLLLPWGVLGREMGWEGVISGAIFLGVLAAGLGYAWGKGVLDWGREGEKD